MGAKVIHGTLRLAATPGDGTGHNILTRDPDTGNVTQLSGSLLTSTLAEGRFLVGNSSNVATAVLPTGDVTFNTSGAFNITPGVIVNADISAAAAIALTKLQTLPVDRLVITNGSGHLTVSAVNATEASYLSGVTSSIQTQLNNKQATITGAATTITMANLTTSRALVSSATGKVAVSTTTAAEVGHLSGVTSPIQTQLNSKLTATISAPTNGDLVYYNGSEWVNIHRGTSGQVLTATSTSVEWANSSSSSLPSGGTTGQVLMKDSGTDFDTSWQTLELGDIGDIVATAAEVNILSGATVTSAELNFLVGTTSPIQSQLNNKLNKSLSYNNIWVGNAGNEATQYAPGNEGEVLMITGGAPQWQPFPLSGDSVVGPFSSTDNAIARWNGTDGISIQNSGVIIDDSDNITGVVGLTAETVRTGTGSGNTLLLQAYDVDGAVYETFATLTAGNTPTFDLNNTTTIGSAYIYRVGGNTVSLADGGSGASLSDPGADAVWVWDDSTGTTRLAALDNLSYDTDTNTLSATGGGGSGHVIEADGTPLTDRNNLNVTNGLTAADNTPDTDVKLGGTLLENTTIDADGKNFSVSDIGTGFFGTSAAGLTVASSTAYLQNAAATRRVGVNGSSIILNVGSDAGGDVYYRAPGGNLARLGIGTSGQVLAVSSGGIPEWATAAGTYTDENAQDAVGGILVDTDTIDFTYTDATPSITADVKANSITDALLRQSAAVSLIGRSANSTGNVADIAAASNGQVMMRSSDSLSFGLVTGANFSNASANTFFGGPTSGSAASATFRALAPIDLPFPSRTESATTYTVQASDRGYTIYFTSATGCVVTMPTGLATDFWFTAVRAKAAGQISFITSSATINTVANQTTIDYANGAVMWEYLGDTNGDWYGFGALGPAGGGGGGGGVSSVNNSNITGFATATGGPITGSGTLGYTLNTQSANTFFAGPESGSSDTPAFRQMVMVDVPRPAKNIPDAAYTITDSDLGASLYFTNSSGCTVTLDNNITVSNFWCLTIKDKLMTSGNIHFVTSGGATMLTVDSETDIIAANGAASWEVKGTDWYGWGTFGSGSGGGGSGGHVIENSGSSLPERPNLNFTNGLTAVDSNPDSVVKLGGNLTEHTVIGGAFLLQTSVNQLTLSSTTSSSLVCSGSNTGITFAPAGTVLSLGGDVNGDIYYRSSGFLTRLPVGSANTILGANTAGTAPEYKTVSNGLTAASGTLKLGGALTENTTIAGSHTLTLSNTLTVAGWAQFRSNAVEIGASNTITSSTAGLVHGTTSTISNTLSAVIAGEASTSSGHGSLAIGRATTASGNKSFAGGWHRESTTPGTGPIASGAAAFAFYVTNNSNTAGYGAKAEGSAILAGLNNNIESGNTYSAIIAGQGISLTGSSYQYHTAVSNLAIFATPGDGGTDDVLTWNATTKKIGKVSQASIGGGGSGSVTSVAATAPAAGFTISGSPITTTGTLTFALADDLAALEGLSGSGIAVRTGTNAWTNRTITGGTGITVTNGNGVSANPSVALSHLGIQNLSNPGADRLMFWDQSGSKTEWLTVDTNTLTISGTTLSANYGSGTPGQVAYWSGANTLTGESGFEYDDNTNVLSAPIFHLGSSKTVFTSAAGPLSGRVLTISSQTTSNPMLSLTGGGTDGDALMYLGDNSINDSFSEIQVRGNDNGSASSLVMQSNINHTTHGQINTLIAHTLPLYISSADGDIIIDPTTNNIDLRVTASADVVSASTHTITIKIGGVSYKVLLASV